MRRRLGSLYLLLMAGLAPAGCGEGVDRESSIDVPNGSVGAGGAWERPEETSLPWEPDGTGEPTDPRHDSWADTDGQGPAPVIPFEGEALPPTVLDGLVLRVMAEGHLQPDGTMTLPAMEQDLVYLVAHLETEEGVPVAGAPVRVTTPSGNQVLLDHPDTDLYGYASFTLFLSEPGRAEFTVTAFGLENRFEVDAMRLEESPWLQGIQGPGIVPWSRLRNARIHFGGEGFTGRLRTEFGPEVEPLEGERIRLAGYMLPMTPDPRQTEFLLSASPPNCFFHPPGGPTTLILVETDPRTPVPSTQDPLVVEGTLELVRESEYALVYHLKAARLRDPPHPSDQEAAWNSMDWTPSRPLSFTR